MTNRKKRPPYLIIESNQSIIHPRFCHADRYGNICGIYLARQQPGGGIFKMPRSEFLKTRLAG